MYQDRVSHLVASTDQIDVANCGIEQIQHLRFNQAKRKKNREIFRNLVASGDIAPEAR